MTKIIFIGLICSFFICIFTLIHIGDGYAKQKTNIWYDYNKVVILEGTLVEDHDYGPPNYGENPETDSKVTYCIICLDKPIDVRTDLTNPVDTDTIKGIRKIKLEIFPFADIKDVVGKRVAVKGKLRQHIWGHDYTRVIISILDSGIVQAKTRGLIRK
jgi:hypothetical protein